LLSTYRSCSVGVLALHTLFVCLSILRWYICGDNQDLAIWGLKLFSWIVRGYGRTGDLKREAVWRRLPVVLATMSRGERSSKLLEYTALASRMFRILVDEAGFVEVTPAVSTIWCLGSRFDLYLVLHVAGCYMSCLLQAKRHAGG
jgi:hypothetical protein